VTDWAFFFLLVMASTKAYALKRGFPYILWGVLASNPAATVFYARARGAKLFSRTYTRERKFPPMPVLNRELAVRL
jgi:hypothetical protein